MNCTVGEFRWDFWSSLIQLARCHPRLMMELRPFLVLRSWSFQDKQGLLERLGWLSVEEEFIPFLLKTFHPLLLEILERAIKLLICKGQSILHEQFSFILSCLLQQMPHIKDIALKYFNSSPFFDILKEDFLAGGTLSEDRLLRIVKAGHNLLEFDFETFSKLWEWSAFLRLVQHRNLNVRWHAVHIAAIIARLTDQNKLAMIEKLFEEEERNSLLLRKDTNVRTMTQYLDGNDLPQLDINAQFQFDESCPNGASFSEKDFTGSFVTICGVLLPQLTQSTGLADRSLVMVPSTYRNLHSLTVAVASGAGVLLEGPVGSGKTALVECLAVVTGRSGVRDLLTVQLGDQTDSKSLLGTYICTDTPGEFVWQPGTLLQAVTNGSWILLEDIDFAPMDVVSILIPLLETRTLSVPALGNVKAAAGFQLFATQRTHAGSAGFSHQASANSLTLERLWAMVYTEPLSKEELTMILCERYPDLTPITAKLVDVFCMLSTDPKLSCSGETNTSQLTHDHRLSTTRDFMKWCSRIASTTRDAPLLSSAQDIFLEAQDCFSATLPNNEIRYKLSMAVGAKLGLSKDRVEFFHNSYKPRVHTSTLSLTVGRITLNRKSETKLYIKPQAGKFAHTRHALLLLERVAACIRNQEPVLLVGETGTGKTSLVQYLGQQCGYKLRVINMSQQSDSTDLLGGFKPVDMKQLVSPLREQFEKLFCQTFSRKQNTKFLSHVQHCFAQGQWEVLFKLMLHCHKSAANKLMTSTANEVDEIPLSVLLVKWQGFVQKVQQARKQQRNAESALAFHFVEGALVQAIRNGEWVLLDEINLAMPETLECLSGLLESSSGSVVLLDRGDLEPVVRHKDFHLFACMNPATDVGKKGLPPGIRNRFTEVFVDELSDTGDLKTLVVDYLCGLSPAAAVVDGIVRFYLTAKDEASKKLTDGTGHKPHYSLRTLCRALRYASGNPHASTLRSLYEGFCLSFLTQLDRASHPLVKSMIIQHILGHVNASGLLKQPLPKPQDSGEFTQFEGYWVAMGDKNPVVSREYVLTPSVKANLQDLARVVSGRTFPVLLQGETSVGKTSLIQWLAKASGNVCVRINNHEHTDIQEYLGSYTSDEKGKLVFKEGVLIDAMRRGHWVILDELNLAPSDVLEALNRLLDDNRELFIPETQETVSAHAKFMLFATQNPPGQYGGRKVLSRAFRNRFVELHFDELPSSELETILCQRCSLPLTYAKKLVAVLLDLQAHRRSSSVFAGKQGFITLRDLFRWAERYNKAPDVPHGFKDWNQHLAEDGYMLLAGRCRNPSECEVIQQVIETHLKRKLDVNALFGKPDTCSLSPFSSEFLTKLMGPLPDGFSHIVWTQNMRRLAVLAGRALYFGEPVLLVGETGCGKTTICQLFAALNSQQLYSVNCHMHSESADFLGGLRPVRSTEAADEQDGKFERLFEWTDGPLVRAMKEGSVFLADEISLADDSVLERLNSVLEPERTLVLAEKGGEQDVCTICAAEQFRIVSTMNPGGDFGKKELSPALRNRFTEIWCPATDQREDLIQLIEHNLLPGISLPGNQGFGELIMDFIDWFRLTDFGKRFTISIRDLLSWIFFMNTCCTTSRDEASGDTQRGPLDARVAYVHGACLVFLDALGSGLTAASVASPSSARQLCVDFLRSQVSSLPQRLDFNTEFVMSNEWFGIAPFYIPRGPLGMPDKLSSSYALRAPTTSQNALRLLRALQLPRPILLEGSPGVGKTSLVAAIAKACGHELVRINLSEQTDVTDLFGADLPVEGGRVGQFAWRDGPLLRALRAGHWVVLDELNLASQSVLEGLNACLDHRAEVYIPELGTTFKIQHQKTTMFACQNPLNQGGGRKGLPKSFLNRFTQVYMEPLSKDDLLFITEAMYPDVDSLLLEKMVTFNMTLHRQTVVESRWGRKGGPWEFNLRDVFRWCDLLTKHQSPGHWDPSQFVKLIYCDRMRAPDDKAAVLNLYQQVFGEVGTGRLAQLDRTPLFHITPTHLQVGHSWLPRRQSADETRASGRGLHVLHRSLHCMESLLTCLQMNWMTILVGPRSCGKTSLVQLIAQLTGNKLEVMAMNSAMDTTELLGGFEQASLNRQWKTVLNLTQDLVLATTRDILHKVSSHQVCQQGTACGEASVLYGLWETFLKHLQGSDEDNNENADDVTIERLKAIESVLQKMQTISVKYGVTQEAFNDVSTLVTSLESRLVFRGGNAHCGGQFEWVDGQLVNALKFGHWLLIDNVNFCSPSVLDRLNALLEPGGVLSVSERGVIDGEIPTIKPHPNFRLIFAMDPRYGEISRAMRNRGVEIYILGEDEDSARNDRDIKVLLSGLGLRHEQIHEFILKFHETFKQSLGGSVLDIIHAATLTVQLLQRGSDVLPALGTALTQVYVRSQALQHNKEVAQELVTSHLAKGFDSDQACVDVSGLVTRSLPSARDFSENSVLSTLRWHCAPLIQFFKHDPFPWQLHQGVAVFLERSTLYDWRLRLDFLQTVFGEAKPSCASQNNSVASVFSSSLSRICNSELMERLKTCHLVLEKSCRDFGFMSHQPWDLRLNSDLWHRLAIKCEQETNTALQETATLANRLRLLEMRTQRALQEERQLSLTSQNRRMPRNAVQLSFLLHSGELSSDSLPHSVLAHIWPLFSLFDTFVEGLICKTNSFSDEDLWKVLVSFTWRDRLRRHCEQQVQDEFPVALLTLHWHWFLERSLYVIPQHLAQICQSEFPPDLVTVVTQMIQLLGADTRAAKTYVSVLSEHGRPSPFKSVAVHEIWEKLIITCRSLDMVDSGEMFLDKKEPSHSKFLLPQDCAVIKSQLVTALVKVLNLRQQVEDETESDHEYLKADVQSLTSKVVFPEDSVTVEGAPSEKKIRSSESNLEILLWPLFNTINLRQEGELLKSLMLLTVNAKMGRAPTVGKNDIVQRIEACMAFSLQTGPRRLETVAVHRHLCSILKQDTKTQKELAMCFKGVQADLLCSYLGSANALLQIQAKLIARTGQDEKEESSETERQFYDLHSATLPFGLLENSDVKVICASSSPLDSVSIGEHTEKLEQLKRLSQHFWVNGDVMATSKEHERMSEKHFLALMLSQILLSLKVVLAEDKQEMLCDVIARFLSSWEEDSESFEAVVKSLSDVITQMTEAYYHVTGDNTRAETMKTLLTESVQQLKNFGGPLNTGAAAQHGLIWVKLGLIQSLIFAPVGPVDPVYQNAIERRYVEEEIEEIEQELSVRFFAEEIWTGEKAGYDQLDNLLSEESWEQLHITSNPHRAQLLLRRLKELKSHVQKLRKSSAFRPSPSQFELIVRDTEHFMSTVGNPHTVLTILSEMEHARMAEPVQTNTVQRVLQREQAWRLSYQKFNDHIRKEFPLYWDLLAPFAACTAQVLYGMEEVACCLRTWFKQQTFLLKCPAEEPCKAWTPGQLAVALCAFPVPSNTAFSDDSDTLMSPPAWACLQGLNEVDSVAEGYAEYGAVLTSRVLKTSLLRLQSRAAQQGYVNRQVRTELSRVLATYLNMWQLAKEKEREREQDKSSLYCFRTKTHAADLDEEAQNEKALREAFPCFDAEFGDLLPAEDLDDEKLVGPETVQQQHLSHDAVSDAEKFVANIDVVELSRIHEHFFCTMPCRVVAWSHAQTGNDSSIPRGTEDLKAFASGYQAASLIYRLCPWSAEEVPFCTCHMLQACFMQQTLSVHQDTYQGTDEYFKGAFDSKRSEQYDFYHDSNIEEAVKVRPILEGLMVRIKELLAEWPGHPTLGELELLIKRLLSLPVTSPLMKVLTGSELLLRKAQEWESNASSQVSLKEHLDKITQMIIQWRRLELRCWTSLLDVAAARAADKAKDWWFHLYHVMHQFTVDEPAADQGSAPSIEELIELLQRFVETSTLGEYCTRVKMLDVFYHQLSTEHQVTGRDEHASDLLWNLHKYYQQFAPVVGQLLQQRRQPIEKELKDYVKIAKWNDANFWAMKQAAEKSHRTLHKFVRKFQTCLNEPVQKVLADMKTLSPTEQEQSKTGADQEQVNWFISPESLQMYFEERGLVFPDAGPVTSHSTFYQETVHRFPKLFFKTRQLCQKILRTQRFAQLVTSLNEFTGDVIATVHKLQALDVSSQPAEKRAVTRKHIHLRKRKALADLFKALATTGLSYRKGLNLNQRTSKEEAMLLPAVDNSHLSAALLGSGASALSDLTNALWSEGLGYYFRCLARAAAFSNAMATPSKELSVRDVDRCKGITHHLLHMAHVQRREIGTVLQNAAQLSLSLENLMSARPGTSENKQNKAPSLPPQKDLMQWSVRLMRLLTYSAQTLRQFTVLLKCCPDKEFTPASSPVPCVALSSLATTSASESVVSEVRGQIQACLHEVQQLSNRLRPHAATFEDFLDYGDSEDPIPVLATWNTFAEVCGINEKLKRVAGRMDAILPAFRSECCSEAAGLGGALFGLKQKMIEVCGELEQWKLRLETEIQDTTGKTEPLCDGPSLLVDVDGAVTSLLLAVQRLSNKADSKSNEERESTLEDTEEVSDDAQQLPDGLLVTLLHKKILEDVAKLRLPETIKLVSSIISKVRVMADSSDGKSHAAGGMAQTVTQITPFVHQYRGMVQNYLYRLLSLHRGTCKLLSVLLSIFTELTTKGFCLPPEIDEEAEGDGATEFEDIEGGGLGQGDGMKDVSDQIESEDQLDDTKQQGEDQETNEGNKEEIPDEENAIEMSEDFDGAMHDLEAEDDEAEKESDKEEEEEADLDKKMGEVDGQESEKLDQKLWGDSDDEDDQEEKDQMDEKGTGAEAIAESEMVAKEENKGAADESKNKDDEDNMDQEEEQKDAVHEMAQDEDTGNLSDQDDVTQPEPTGGQQAEKPEDEHLDLPDDIQLDEEDEEGKETEGEEENMEGGMPTEEESMEIEEDDKLDVTSPDADTMQQNQEEEEVENKEEEQGDEEAHDGTGLNPQDEECSEEQEDWRTHDKTKESDAVEAAEDLGTDGTQEHQVGNLQEESTGPSEPQDGGDENGLGRAEASQSGHAGEMADGSTQVASDTTEQSRQRKLMNRARSDRSLGSMEERTHKRLRTVDESEQRTGAEDGEKKTADYYQHMRDDDVSVHDAQTLDSATADQAKEQEGAAFPEMLSENEEETQNEDLNALWKEMEELKTSDNNQQSRAPPAKSDVSGDVIPAENDVPADNKHENEATDVDVPELARESTFHSSEVALDFERMKLSSFDPEKLRSDLEHQLSVWSGLNRGTVEEQRAAQATWGKYELLTSSLSHELCEQLRLVLEPSLATKLKGDYRSGKRLNMRKIIPYIASQFRKDKIWLRRTKPSKRQYQIMLAVDDSSSMADNHSKQLAFESLALISNALTRLESGDLAVCSFGESVQLLHPFHEQFTDQSGARILQQFSFDQKKTRIAELLRTSTSLMMSARSRLQGSAMRQDVSQLLLVVSDGRGIFLEGMETVHQAVRAARQANVFLVFVILDNPVNRDSILDIKVPLFRPGKLPEIKSYMEQFPFPFYIILRDINALPVTLSDALRQWFELVTTLDT